VHPFPDRDALADLEHAVLRVLDPPLNLDAMPTTELRARVSELRRRVSHGPQTPTTARDGSAAASLDRAIESIPGPAVPRPGGDKPTLHDELADVLATAGNQWTTVGELADAVNRRGHYRKGDGSPVTNFQVARRTHRYDQLFERDGSRIRLWQA